MYPECARGTKHPVSFAVSVTQIVDLKKKKKLKLVHLLSFFFLFFFLNMAVQIPCQNIFHFGSL